MLSAYAGSNEALRRLSGFWTFPRQMLIVHGEPDASLAVRNRIASAVGRPYAVMTMHDPVNLEAGRSVLSNA